MKTYGLALGGGAARGIAHIGVLEYLEENDIKITEVSGTSMGALIGAAYALGKSPADMQQILANMSLLKLIDLNMKSGIVSGKKVENFLKVLFGDARIEDTKIPLYILGTHLESGKKKVFTSGSIVEAVRASISLPSVFTPAEIEDKKYLDGGLNENLPVSVLSSQNIIAVSVVREDFSKNIPTHKKIFGFEFRSSFFKYNYRILKRTIGIMMKNNEDFHIELCRSRGKNIILIAPDVSDYEYFDFMKYEEISKLGYEEIRKVF
ncbi:patatin-like phospholipase family protein [Candidatus Gracilibacteria bacterium]|nr:patatin-like phospholipase family protein [Candidatus Gracilibacteria bacterium]